VSAMIVTKDDIVGVMDSVCPRVPNRPGIIVDKINQEAAFTLAIECAAWAFGVMGRHPHSGTPTMEARYVGRNVAKRSSRVAMKGWLDVA
jgi:hypothetical protein